MRPSPFTSGLILRPGVALIQAWTLAASLWTFVAVMTVDAPLPGEPLRLIDARAFALLSVAHASLFAVWLWEARHVARAPVGLRRAQVAAHAGALVLLIALQVLAHLVRGVTPA